MESPSNNFLALLHPAVTLGFFACALGLTVLVAAPAFVALSFGAAACCLITVRGRRAWGLIGGLVPLVVLVAAMNPLFNTEGATVLFAYGDGRPYTAEALIRGIAMGATLAAALLWFASLNAVLTSDKATFLFGSAAPALTTVLTLVMRLVPGYGRRATEVFRARRALGRDAGEPESLAEKVRAGATVLGALTGWALDHGVVTADSMAARGFGSGKRTSYRSYRFTGRDGAVVAVAVVLLMAIGAGVLAGAVPLGYVPADTFAAGVAPSPLAVGVLVAYGAFLLLPAALNLGGEVRWRCSLSNI